MTLVTTIMHLNHYLYMNNDCDPERKHRQKLFADFLVLFFWMPSGRFVDILPETSSVEVVLDMLLDSQMVVEIMMVVPLVPSYSRKFLRIAV